MAGPPTAHVSCADCGLIFHADELDDDKRCKDCAKAAADAKAEKPAARRR